jgi:signal transduction histidine kinase/CheY-like chemotaxis protein
MEKKLEPSQTPDAASPAGMAGCGAALLPPGGGETGALIRSIDWSRTRLGPVEGWPRSLLAALGILVESQIPNWLWWGPELVQFYNDASLPIMGRAKHPEGMGQPGRESWAEAFPVVEPILLAALEQGRPSFVKDGFLPLNRYGYVEECYFDYAYTPIRDDDGQPGGVFCTVIEKTDHILAERRLRTLHDASASAQRRVEDAAREAARVLAGNPHDVPFALLYLIDEDQKRATLMGAAGLAPGSAEAPARIELGGAGDDYVWPVAEVFRSRTARLVEHLDERGLALPGGPWPQPSTSALVLPISDSGHQQLAAVLVAGLGPMRPMDAKYRSFLELVAGQIESALATARAYETERLRAESLAELDRAKTAFFSNVSHELRTPLTLILGPVEDALAQSAHVLQGEALRTVHRSAQRLLRLVNSLLDFSRIEAGRLQAQIEPTDLAALTADVASSFRSLVEREGLTFVVDCPPLPEPVLIDRTMWEKIVLNLLSNAFKFTLAGEISVRLAWRDDHVELSVHDTGAGIPASELEHIFDRFHRVEGARGRSFEGTGIGLALAHELVALHGGTIRVSSIEGQGSTFAVIIPKGSGHAAAAPGVLATPATPGALATPATPGVLATPATPGAGETRAALAAAPWLPGSETPSWATQGRGDAGARHADPQAAPAPGAANGGAPRSRILIADDNADMRAYLIHLLQTRWEVEAVGDGETALASARARPPDLVLSDVMMPRLDGLGLLRELRADPHTRTIPVVLLSARAGEEAVLSGLETGADDYLVKPFSARELLARVRTQLEMAQARRAAVEAAERERGQAMLRFLADASSTLAESLDYATTLTRVAELAVPFLADWCFLDILEEDGSAQRVQVAHAGAAHAATVTQVKDFSVLMSGNPAHPPTRALREQRPVLIEDNDEARMRASAHSEEHFQAMKAVGAGSLMSLPLVARGRALGVLTLIVSVSGRRYGAPDLALAEELARRCALAMDNARLHRQLQDALHLRDDFLAIAAHELRTPVTALQLPIASVLHAAEQPGAVLAPAWVAARLGKTLAQVERMTTLIDHLLDVSRITSGRLEIRHEPVDLSAIASDVVARVREQPARPVIQCAVEEGIVGQWDRYRVEQVVAGLVGNAVKFGEGQPIEVTLERRDGTARLRVIDHGMGIQPEDRERIFQRFERAVSVRKFGGFGLGLWITRQVVEAMGGKIDVDSEPGRGAAFTVELPLRTPQA